MYFPTELFLAGSILIPILTILALIDIVRRPASDWTDGSYDKLMWVGISVFVSVIGPILYFAIGRPSGARAPSAPKDTLTSV